MHVEWWLTLSKIVGVVAQAVALIAGAAILYFGARVDANRKTELAQLASIQHELVSENVDLLSKDGEKSKRIEELVRGQRRQVSTNVQLTSELGKQQSDLKLKNAKIAALESKAKRASRGIVSTYDYNGARRETSAGKSVAIAGPEMDTFAKMAELEKDGKVEELIKLATEQIRKTPKWLTPHMFLGAAYANSGRKKEAIREFEYVVEAAAGDPEYATATEYLTQLRGR